MSNSPACATLNTLTCKVLSAIKNARESMRLARTRFIEKKKRDCAGDISTLQGVQIPPVHSHLGSRTGEDLDPNGFKSLFSARVLRA
jgi:hypothetical protein